MKIYEKWKMERWNIHLVWEYPKQDVIKRTKPFSMSANNNFTNKNIIKTDNNSSNYIISIKYFF